MIGALDAWPYCCYCAKPLTTHQSQPLHNSARFCQACKAARHDAQRRARSLVRSAIRTKALPAATALPCVDCGAPAALYDHRDYNRPLDVQPVCRSCNHIRGPARWIPAEKRQPEVAL